MRQITSIVCAAILIGLQGCSPQYEPSHIDEVGDQYEIRFKQTTQSSGEGSTGSSTSNNVLVERVISKGDNGVELEFDLPEATPDEYRKKEWIYPVRVFRSWDGTLRLTNEPELEARLSVWLDAGGIDRSDCGKWLFTWTAVKIECDPKSALHTISAFDMRAQNIKEGANYAQVGGLGESTIQLDRSASGTLFVDLPIDPAAVRTQRAESDVIVAEIMGPETITIEEAFQNRESEKVSGSLNIQFKVDPLGQLIERVTTSTLVIQNAEGEEERLITKTILTRVLIGGPTFDREQVESDKPT